MILVSHQLENLRDADRVVVLDGGRVVEDGPPDRVAYLRGLRGGAGRAAQGGR